MQLPWQASKKKGRKTPREVFTVLKESARLPLCILNTKPGRRFLGQWMLWTQHGPTDGTVPVHLSCVVCKQLYIRQGLQSNRRFNAGRLVWPLPFRLNASFLLTLSLSAHSFSHCLFFLLYWKMSQINKDQNQIDTNISYRPCRDTVRCYRGDNRSFHGAVHMFNLKELWRVKSTTKECKVGMRKPSWLTSLSMPVDSNKTQGFTF